jgi:phage baseplate assembly protein W
MAFFHELRRAFRVSKWRRLRVALHHWEGRIALLEEDLIEEQDEDLEAHLQAARRRRNKVLRQLGVLETKEKKRVQA